MDFHSVERKWQARWEKAKLNQFDKKDTERKKLYVLEMFSYPSGAKLHIGHWYNSVSYTHLTLPTKLEV